MPNPPQLDLVVGVAASAGGLDAFRQLLAALPGDLAMAYILVQHLSPSHRSMLTELLAPHTELSVVEAEEGAELRPGTVFVIRPGTALSVRQDRIEVSSPTEHRSLRLPADQLFRSLAREYGSRAAGIVFSGAGSDGSDGLRAIKSAGGLTMAQDPTTCSQPGMPRSAIATDAVDLVCEIADMPGALERFASLPPKTRTGLASEELEKTPERLSSLDKQHLEQLADLLESQLGFDLRVYKPASVERRVLRRMTLSGFDDIAKYLEHLDQGPAEQRVLVRDLLISVTEFFRDPLAFNTLRESTIDPLVAASTAGDTLRVWVPACATGDEAYSLGMEILDSIEHHGKRLHLQVFATDVDQDALTIARAAVYPPSVADHVSARRLARYFRPVDGRGYQVESPLRDAVSFAAHDLTKDPPFSRMNFVSCRNVLIYLTLEAQKHVLKTLHFALVPGGHLFLGSSESTATHRDLFVPVSKPHRIFRKIGASRPLTVPHSRSWTRAFGAPRCAPPSSGATWTPHGTDQTRRAILQAWVPPTVVVDEGGIVTFVHGELTPYLRFPQGENPRLELSALLRPDIATRTRGAVHNCRKGKETVVAMVRPRQPSDALVRVTAKPAPQLGNDVVMVTFEQEAVHGEEDIARPADQGQEAVIEQLESELQATREDLHSAVEELESFNDDLRAAHEVSMSANEELQSTNEELEATTEELRSLNEELTTVNAELREKIEQLEQAHDDLANFFSSTKIATVFLDDQLRIKRFTHAAAELLSIDQADTDRGIADIARELFQNQLEQEARTVLEHFATITRDLQTRDGRWITREVLPYHTETRRVEGVVVTFTDNTALRCANEDLSQKSRRLELAWEAARGGILEHRVPLDESTYLSDQWAQILGYRRDELPSYDRFLPWLLEQTHPDDRERLTQTYRDFVEGRAQLYEVEVRLRHRAGHWVWVRGISKALQRDADGRVLHLLGMMLDVTDLKRTQEELRESETRFRGLADSLPNMVWVHDATGQQEYVNATFCSFFGVEREEMKGGRWQLLMHPEDADAYNRKFLACVDAKRPFHAEARVRHADGTWRRIESWARPRLTREGEYLGFVGTSVDVTERWHMESALRDEKERFRTLADNMAQLAWMADGEGWIFWYNKRWFDYTGTTFHEMQGWGWKKAHHPEHVARVVEKISRHFASGEVWEDVFPLRRADGAYRWFLSRALPIRNAHGKVVRWFGTHTDITDQREIEQKLIHADRQKDVFLAMLGHELRNPLAAVSSATELLSLADDASPELVHTRGVLERQTGHMAKLLDGLLDVSRFIWGKIELETCQMDLAEVSRQTVADVLSQRKEEEIDVRVEVPAEPVWIQGDPVRMRQVVDNLLTNACKYTPSGGRITMTLERVDEAAVLRVSDTGVGIEPDLLPHVFEVFRQSEQSFDRASGGLGLGLSLVKSLVELHGGSVEARSDGKDHGAEIIVRVPLAKEAQAPSRRPTLPPSGPLRILVIEDAVDVAEMMRLVLKNAGHDVVVAGDGVAGMAEAREHVPDVVLCDLGLPGALSGFDVAKALRDDDRLRESLLIAVSGYGRPDDKARGREAGFDLHLTKPVDFKSLLSLLANRAD